MGHQATGRSDNNVGSGGKGFALLIPIFAFAAPIEGNAGGRNKVGKPLDLLVDLLGQFAGWHQNKGAGMFMASVRNLVQEGNKIGCRFAGAGLGAGDQVFTLDNFGDGHLLNWGGLLVIHGIHTRQYVVVEIEVVKGHVQ